MYREIRCQEESCPHGYQPGQRCCFGEVDADKIKEQLTERHKCKRGSGYVTVVIDPEKSEKKK